MSESDEILAADLARAAGELLLTLRHSGLFTGRPLGAVGDGIANELLVRGLAALCPEDGLLSEESVAAPSRLEHSRVWIVDPLDGTREYSEGREDWAVHVALCIDGTPGPSAVAIPARSQLFSSRPELGTPPVTLPARTGPIRIAVSRSRPPVEAERVARRLAAELVSIGSAGVKTMAVVTGEVDAYLHAGGQYEWDSAAPVGVAVAAGLHASRIDGSPLRYNRPDPTLPDLLVCRAELARPLLAALADPDPPAS
jgi:3'(2'), 5'-bisphosphate nucleotidase